jgi:hypothetical protein
VQAKLLAVCGNAASSVSAVGQGQPWGRGRIAVIPKAADGQVSLATPGNAIDGQICGMLMCKCSQSKHSRISGIFFVPHEQHAAYTASWRPLQVNVEAAVELAYSLSEHGLTPAAFRAFAMSMARSQDAQQVLQHAPPFHC